jgi:Ca-activated chloride channel family protein
VKFLSSYLLWLLLLGPLLVGAYVALLRGRKRGAVSYADFGLVRQAMRGSPRWRRHAPPFLFLCSVLAAIVALAQPMANVLLPSLRQTIILAVDVSLSMDAADVDPNRLTAAQLAAKAFVEGCPPDVRIGLVAFGGSAAAVQPPTDDRHDLLAAIDRFQLQKGTATGSALYVALASLLPEAGLDLRALDLDRRSSRNPLGANLDRPKKSRKQDSPAMVPGSFPSGAIILMSDGKSTMGPSPLDAAEVAAEHGVRVFTIGFGTKEGATVRVQGMSIYVRLDEETLQAIADITRGTYFQAGTSDDLKQVYRDLTARLVVERKDVEITFAFAAAAALLMLASLALSLLWCHPALDGAGTGRTRGS